MPLAIALTIIAVLLVIIGVLAIPVIMIRQGQGIKYIYREQDPAADVPPAVILKEESTPEDAFFDERDLAAREAHEERPEFVHTTIDVNGIRAGSDGVVPLEKEKGFWRR